MVKEKIVKVSILYNAFDLTQVEKHELVYKRNKKLKTYLHDLPDDCEWKIGLNGKVVSIEEHGNLIIKPEDSIQLVVVPHGGEGGKSILRMVALLAIVAFAFFTLGTGIAFLGIAGVGLSGATLGLAVAGVGLIGGLLVNALLPPKMPKTDSEDTTSYGYDGAKNTSKEGVTLPIVYGEFRVAGNYVNAYTENVGDDQYLFGRTVVSDGEIESVTDPYVNDQPIDNYTNVQWGWKSGTSTENVNDWFGRNIVQYNKNVRLFGGNAAGQATTTPNNEVIHTTSTEVTGLQMNLIFPTGLVHVTKKGYHHSRNCDIQIHYKLHSSPTWIHHSTRSYVDNRAKAIRKTIEINGLPLGVYDVKIKKLSTEANPNGPGSPYDTVSYSDSDMVNLVDVGEITNQQVALRNVANAYYKIKMNEQLNSLPNITWKVKGVKVNIYDINGNVTANQWSDNPAWIILDMLIGEKRGSTGVYNIDFPAFLEWAEHCETENLKFNGTFDTTQSLWDACVDVLKVGRASFTRIGSKLSVAVDKPLQPQMLFGPGNIYKGSFKVSYMNSSDRANEFEVSYFDRDNLNQQKTIRVVDYEADNRGDQPKPVTYSLLGVDNFDQAQKEAWYQLYNNRYLNRVITFDAPTESIGLSVGEIALIQHDMMDWGTSGRLASGSTNVNIKLDKNVLMETGSNYSLLCVHDKITKATGVVSSKASNLVTITGVTDTSINTDNVKRLFQASSNIDRAIIDINFVGSTAYVSIDGDNDFDLSALVQFVDTDVIEERDVVFNPNETDTLVLVDPLSAVPNVYSNYMFGVKTIVKKPFRLKSINGTGYDKRTLTFIEYNEAVFNPPEHIVPLPPTTMPKTVNHVTGLNFVYPSVIPPDTNIINGTLSWVVDSVIDYGGADIYISTNSSPFIFYKTVMNVNEVSVSFNNGDEITIKVVSFNSKLTRALNSTAPTTTAAILSSTPSFLDKPTDLNFNIITQGETVKGLFGWSAGTITGRLYRIQIQIGQTGNYVDLGTSVNTSLILNQLTGGTHNLRVRTQDNYTSSDWSVLPVVINVPTVVAPSFANNSTTLSHVANNDGSVNITLKWLYSGGLDNIDGFIVTTISRSSSLPYTIGSDTTIENGVVVSKDTSSFLLTGVAADKYYTFYVAAFKKVEPTFNASGQIKSTAIKPTGTNQNPYQPATTVNIVVNGTPLLDQLNTINDEIDGVLTTANAANSLANTVNTNLTASFKATGGNLLFNTDFSVQGASFGDNPPWGVWTGPITSSPVFSRDLSGDNWRPTNEHNLGITHSIADTYASGKFADWKQTVNIEVGKMYEFSLYAAMHRCRTLIGMAFYDNSDVYVPTPGGDAYTASTYQQATGGTNINNWARLTTRAVAPAGAAKVVVYFRKYASEVSGQDSYAWICRPHLKETTQTATSPLPYTIGAASYALSGLKSSVEANTTAINTTNTNLAQLKTQVTAGNPNLLFNGGFEKDLQGWNVGGAAGPWIKEKNGWGSFARLYNGGTLTNGISYIYSDFIKLDSNFQLTLTADLETYYNSGGSSRNYLQINWYNDAGADLGSTTYGPSVYGPIGFNNTGVNRANLKATGAGPAGTTKCRVFLVSDLLNCWIVEWRQVKLEVGSVATPYSNEATVTQTATALTTVEGKTVAYLEQVAAAGVGSSAAVRLVANGITSGIQLQADNIRLGSSLLPAMDINGGNVTFYGKVTAESIETNHLKISGVTTDRIANNAVSDTTTVINNSDVAINGATTVNIASITRSKQSDTLIELSATIILACSDDFAGNLYIKSESTYYGIIGYGMYGPIWGYIPNFQRVYPLLIAGAGGSQSKIPITIKTTVVGWGATTETWHVSYYNFGGSYVPTAYALAGSEFSYKEVKK